MFIVQKGAWSLWVSIKNYNTQLPVNMRQGHFEFSIKSHNTRLLVNICTYNVKFWNKMAYSSFSNVIEQEVIKNCNTIFQVKILVIL